MRRETNGNKGKSIKQTSNLRNTWKLTKIVVTIDTYTGTLETLRQDGATTILVVNGMEYKSAISLASNPQIESLKPGVKVRLYFNQNGRVSDIEVEEFDVQQIGYLVDAAELSQSFSSSYQMKIFTAAGKMQVYDLADKVELTDDGEMEEPKAVVDAAGLEGKKVKRQPVLYKLNTEGEINYLRYYDPSINETVDGFYQYSGFDGTSSISAWHYRENSLSFGAKLLINNSTLMFSVPTENERELEDNYLVTSSAVFNDGTGNRPFEAYGTKKNNPCAEILVLKGYHNFGSISSDADILVVDGISTVLNDEGEQVVEITGWYNGSYVTRYAEKGIFNGTMVDKGDAVRLLNDKYGFIIKAEMVFDASMHQLMTSNPSNTSFYSKPRFVYGTVTYNDLESMSVRIEGTSDLESYPINKFKIVRVEYKNGKVQTVSKASADQVMDELHYADAASKVLVHTRLGDCKTLIIYD